jgi:hypothetical protein
MASDIGGGSAGAGSHVPPSERTASVQTRPSGLIRYIDARMSRPSVVRPAVRRQRLIDQLDVAVQKPVTLVCAGAGWGKTMLISVWAETTPRPCFVGRRCCACRWSKTEEVSGSWFSDQARTSHRRPRAERSGSEAT